MKWRHLGKYLALCALVTAAAALSGCDLYRIRTKIVPAPLFRTNLVLQRDKPAPVWGTAQPGKTVAVEFAGRRKEAVAGQDGSWLVRLDPLPASPEPRDMKIDYVLSGPEKTGENERFGLVLHNVLVGDVWFCSGQSNMEMGILMTANRFEELKDTLYPAIRLFLIVKDASPFALGSIPSFWFECDRENLTQSGWNGFSAVAFFFGRKLHKELNVPIGLIESAYGGSAIHPWIPPEELENTPSLEGFHQEMVEADRKYEEARKKDPKAKHPFTGIYEYNQLKPAACYNAMVHPIAPGALRGFLWYQGESNVGDPDYAEKMKVLISGWRRVFGQGDLPFYFVQLAPWSYGGTDSLPRTWERQEACLTVPNTGMAVIVDTGEPDNIHPQRKKEVGERLALIALAKEYGRSDIVSSGPVFKEMKVIGNNAVVTFTETGSGLIYGGGKSLSWFTIAGDDLAFQPAQARISGEDTVTVSSPRVPKPAAVRFAWNNTAVPNLFNREGLPARPFRTDRD